MKNSSAVLERIERYYDAAPRPNARVEEHGPLVLFVSQGVWPYYARPRLDTVEPITVDAVRAVVERQAALGVPKSFEWVRELYPELEHTVREAGLALREHPLMLLESATHTPPPPGVHVRFVDADEPALITTQAAIILGFTSPGSARGVQGVEERDAFIWHMEKTAHEPMRLMVRRGLMHLAAAEDERGPLAGGSHAPRGDVTELVGISTLPAERRRGLGAAITSALVEDAHRRGVKTVFLSAGDETIARVYEKVGFRRIATACIAQTA